MRHAMHSADLRAQAAPLGGRDMLDPCCPMILGIDFLGTSCRTRGGRLRLGEGEGGRLLFCGPHP